jgi:hypothetical protein
MFGGGVIIHIDGVVNWGDDQKFARIASQYPPDTTFVEPDSPGGSAYPAINIGDMIWERGLGTVLWKDDMCNSACTLIWLSGRRAVIQRNTRMCFHQPFDSRNGQANSDTIEDGVAHLKHYGLTEYQARALVNAAPPQSARCATEWWAYRLGFHPQIVPTPFATRLCRSKFCLAVP